MPPRSTNKVMIYKGHRVIQFFPRLPHSCSRNTHAQSAQIQEVRQWAAHTMPLNPADPPPDNDCHTANGLKNMWSSSDSHASSPTTTTTTTTTTTMCASLVRPSGVATDKCLQTNANLVAEEYLAQQLGKWLSHSLKTNTVRFKQAEKWRVH